MDVGSGQSNSHRSLPREIPIPKHGSPPFSRCSTLQGSMASQSIPPILSLEPPSSLHRLPLPNYQAYRHDDRLGQADRDEYGSDGLRPRKLVSDVQGKDRRDWKLSPIVKPSLPDESELSGSSRDRFSIRSEDSLDRNWREGFYKNVDERASPKELQCEESLRLQIRQSVDAYDTSLVRKLNASTSDPSSFTRLRLSPPREFRPFNGGFSDVGRPTHRRPNGSPRRLPSATVSPRPIDSPLERWRYSSSGEPLLTPPSTSEHSPPALREFQGINDTASLPSTQVTDSETATNNSCRIRRSASASLLGRGGYESYNEDEDSQMEEAPSSHVSKLKQLTLHDVRPSPPQAFQRVGSKRRASSPPSEDANVGSLGPTRKGLLLNGVGTDIHQKYYQPPPRSASGSFASGSMSSATTMWSSIGQFSAASSISATDWASPVNYPQSPDRDFSSDAAFRSPNSSRPVTWQRQTTEFCMDGKETNDSGAAPIKNEHAGLKMVGGYICECCPKKPRKFETQADLQLHTLEKQYGCHFCNNRFKNKNEAERHQNSLHLRKHSWSCRQLVGNYEAAFHQSPRQPNYADVCGYCGKEFPVPAQWDIRIDHLTTEHKFGECNQSKKFFRADHFRQHLKHSHSGTSGKWTNVLENACMREEMPPTPIHRGGLPTPSMISEEGSV